MGGRMAGERDPEGEPTRVRAVPTVLALLAFVPLGLLLWWAATGPRPEPARLDWEALGFVVEERGRSALEEVAVAQAPDPVLSTRDLAGRQGPLLGTLDNGRLHGDGAFVAVVRDADSAANLTQSPAVAGLVVKLGGDEGFERCGFDHPVPVDAFDGVADRLDGDVHAARGDLTGRCRGGEPHLVVPLVRRIVVPVGALQRLAGRRAESAVLPAGVALAGPHGDVTVTDELDGAGTAGSAPPGDVPLPVYPREVARQALARAAPANPNLAVGALGDPAYPVLARDTEGLWWVLPVSPNGDGSAVSALARTRADRSRAGELNTVLVEWLADPLPGPALLERRALAVLEERGEVASDALGQLRVWLSVPDAEGAWHGHVTFAGGLRYRVTADAEGTVCVVDVDGHEIGCRGAQP